MSSISEINGNVLEVTNSGKTYYNGIEIQTGKLQKKYIIQICIITAMAFISGLFTGGIFL